MDNPALNIFRAVARSGSVAAAAAAVHSVPSNVSARLRKLEGEIGTPLFLRQARGMQLTAAGEVLLDYAERILALTDEARAAVAEIGGGGGRLRLGSMESTAAVRLPPLLTAFARSNPRLHLSLLTGPSSEIVTAVLQRRIDIGLVAGPVDHPHLQGHAVFAEELVLAVAAGAAAAPPAGAPILVFRNGCAYRARAESWARRTGGQVGAVMEFGSLDGLLGCVAAGMGVSVLPRSVVDQPAWRGQIAALALEEACCETWVIRHRDSGDGAGSRAFVAALERAGGLGPSFSAHPLPSAGGGGCA